MFLFYSEIIFLYYFNDLNGALLATASFCAVTGVMSYFATAWDYKWFGMGLVIGSFLGFSLAYYRLRWVERNMDIHTFCNGELFPGRKGRMPDSVVYRRQNDR